MATANYDNVKALFDGLTGRVDVKNIVQLPGEKPLKGGEGEEKAKAKTFNEYSEPELRKMKTENFDQFKNLFKAEYGEEYTA